MQLNDTQALRTCVDSPSSTPADTPTLLPAADLLAASAAGLAAASTLYRNIDLNWSRHALTHAESLYQLATSTPGKEQSYCKFVPCYSEVYADKLTAVVKVSDIQVCLADMGLNRK